MISTSPDDRDRQDWKTITRLRSGALFKKIQSYAFPQCSRSERDFAGEQSGISHCRNSAGQRHWLHSDCARSGRRERGRAGGSVHELDPTVDLPRNDDGFRSQVHSDELHAVERIHLQNAGRKALSQVARLGRFCARHLPTLRCSPPSARLRGPGLRLSCGNDIAQSKLRRRRNSRSLVSFLPKR